MVVGKTMEGSEVVLGFLGREPTEDKAEWGRDEPIGAEKVDVARGLR